MRLIDADVLLAECKEAQESDPNADGRGWANHFLNAAGKPSAEWYCVEDMIENAPTVDAVPVVRCRECKFSQPWYADKSRCFLWHESGIDVFNDGYCSYGKRKEDVHNDTDTET